MPAMRGKAFLALIPIAVAVGCGSSSAGSTVGTHRPSLDSAGQLACSDFSLAKTKAGWSEDSATGELQKGLSDAQQSATDGFSDALSAGVTGGSARDKANQLLVVCKRYGY